MADFTVEQDIRDVASSLRSFIELEVVPLELKHEKLLSSERYYYREDGRLVDEVLDLRSQVRQASAQAGFYTIFGAPELGGGGLSAAAVAYIQEDFNRYLGPGRTLVKDAVIPSPFTNGLTPVLRSLAPEVRDLYLDDIREGRKTLCFGLSEPDAGSDVLGMRTTAVRDGDEWVISGTKQWITNAAYADYAMVFAVTDREAAAARKGGITGFFLDTKAPGFECSSVLPIMGHLGGEAGIITLDKVRVPADHVIGEVDRGLKTAMGGIGAGRMSVSAMCVGLAQWALDKTLEYARERKTFGKPIGEHQMIQMHLAEMAMSIYAVKNMVANCAWLIDSGKAPIKELSMVKASATEMLFSVMDRAIQVHGAMGLSNEVGLEHGLRLARIVRIPDGSGEIQRRTIARQLLAGNRDL